MPSDGARTRGFVGSLLIIGILVASTACAPPPPPPQDGSAAARTEITRLREQVTEWYAAADHQALAALYDDDARIFSAGAVPIAGGAAIAEHFRNMVEGADWDVVLSADALEISDPLAVERGRYEILLRFPGADAPISDTGSYLLVWRHGPSGWKILYDSATSESRH